MLSGRSVLHLIHGVELALELNEVARTGRASVEETLLELVQGIHHLQEIALLQEELIILQVCLL